MPNLQRLSSNSLTSLANPDRVALIGVRSESPRPVDMEWDRICATGTTPLETPLTDDIETCNFALARMFGPKVSVVCRSNREPSDAAMPLLWKFGGACSIAMASQTQPAHLLRYIPTEFCFTPSEHPVAASSQFLLTPSTVELRNAARSAPANGTVVIIDTDDERTARNVALMLGIRNDLVLFGCTGALPDGARQLHPAVVGTDAFERIANLRTGGSSFVAGVLSRRDAMWINQVARTTLKAGDVIYAPFSAHGIDQTLFMRWYETMQPQALQRLDQAIHPKIDLLPQALLAPPTVEGNPGIGNLRAAIRRLGPTVVYGASGNIGSAIVETLGGKVPVTAIARQPGSVALERLGSPRYPVRQYRNLPEVVAVKTVFMTASVKWPVCPLTQRTVFDRALLLEDNLQNVIIPQLSEIPAEAEVVQIITNPSSDLSYAAWLLRPDLSHAISAHVGTDIVRQHAHVTQPCNPETWFTFGPHSPSQVNVDLAAGSINPTIPLLGKILNDEAGDRSVIDPTGLSSIVEAARLHTEQPGCYGLPLTAQEARQLSDFMDRELGRPVNVSDGIAPTLPRDSRRQIRWDMLRRAGAVPSFADQAQKALLEMEAGREQVLKAITRRVNARHPGTSEASEQWVLANRDKLLSMCVGG